MAYKKRDRNLYDTKSKVPFKLSRTRLENFINCQRCFYLDRRLGVDQPPGFPFNLNSAVDHLLKKEFDLHRAKNEKHPLMKHYKVDAVPYQNSNLDQWRDNFTGVQFLHAPTNFLVFGAVDDIWINPQDELIVVDYKATSKDGPISIDAEWQNSYKRQMEVYQWLLRQNGFKVNNTGYFVYVNGKRDAKAFDGKLEFDINLIPYTGDDSWVEDVLLEAKKCLESKHIPKASPDCDYCNYRLAAAKVEKQ
ncbi:MAG: hypothetical protein COT81_00680 [Candidatus Buchananbacteria bacterium CG10_big_fil_rev_8_21_14_0_10_42_9]|uniref:PD-(D/E)XK endonuclease-like domain-containing protein n=1 Tax=Candidatus Buchananbacteria bacterium CG10_big_fil_rev_8_21_14_0_10_42_9 TaxID=1974526 RepID=A0A2H0W2B5_9BACT|nr:MAG: hypothetical protein COT81_00680 [Candidatus Buchananbacteria bacterium CG10_big_fil_rev_8_21_14_0_10_42_9]